MKKLIIPAVIMFFGLSLIIGGICTNKIPGQELPTKQPVYVPYFNDKQILLPDYVCADTLIVMDSETLNKNFAYYEQDINWGADADIDSLLHCTNKQGLLTAMTFEEYLEFLDGEGYRVDIARHIALVDFGRIAADKLYESIIND